MSKLHNKITVGQNLTVNVQAYKRVPLHGASDFSKGFSTVQDGLVKITFNAYVDLDELNTLAQRAFRNKAGRSHDGALYVNIIGKEKL